MITYRNEVLAATVTSPSFGILRYHSNLGTGPPPRSSLTHFISTSRFAERHRSLKNPPSVAASVPTLGCLVSFMVGHRHILRPFLQPTSQVGVWWAANNSAHDAFFRECDHPPPTYHNVIFWHCRIGRVKEGIIALPKLFLVSYLTGPTIGPSVLVLEQIDMIDQ